MFPAPRLRRRADGGRLGRVGVDHLRQFANAGSGHHRLGDLSDQLAGAARDYRRAEDVVGTVGDMELDEAEVVAVDAPAVDGVTRAESGVHSDSVANPPRPLPAAPP